MGSVDRDKRERERERERKERHLLNQSLVVDKFSKTSTWHHSKQTNRGEEKFNHLKIAILFIALFYSADSMGGASGLDSEAASCEGAAAAATTGSSALAASGSVEVASVVALGT
uniref:Uncharacterized protein n=1 Tax=Micrurus spixii TaxID=129469 RepID=A0A2D4N4G7_9SAUR